MKGLCSSSVTIVTACIYFLQEGRKPHLKYLKVYTALYTKKAPSETEGAGIEKQKEISERQRLEQTLYNPLDSEHKTPRAPRPSDTSQSCQQCL